MLAIRLFLVVVGVVLVISIFGYAVSKDVRWLNLIKLTTKTGLAIIAILLLLLLLERLFMVI